MSRRLSVYRLPAMPQSVCHEALRVFGFLFTTESQQLRAGILGSSHPERKHDKSFLVVGHTKFTPDQLFGLMLHIAEKYITM